MRFGDGLKQFSVRSADLERSQIRLTHIVMISVNLSFTVFLYDPALVHAILGIRPPAKK